MLVAGGSTNVTTYFTLRLAADGTTATGLTITDIDLQYVRSGVAPVAKVDATALAATDSVHGDNQAIEIDATDQPGLYRVDWPDAAFAAGVREVILTVKVATAFTEHLRVEIDGEVNVVEWAGTDVVAGAIPAAAADAAGGLVISDAGGFDIDAITAALIADAVLDETGSVALTGNPTSLRELVYFVVQMFRNKLDYDKGLDTMIMFEDDNAAKKWTHTMTDDAGNATRGKGA